MRVISGSFRWNSSDEVGVNLDGLRDALGSGGGEAEAEGQRHGVKTTNSAGRLSLCVPPAPAIQWQRLKTKGFKRLRNEFYSIRLQFGTDNIHGLKRSLPFRLARSRDI